MVMIKEENAMETEPSGAGKALPFGVSPVALQLNRLVERTQHHTSSSAMFQLPPGAIPSISACPILAAQPKVVSSTRHTQPLTSILKPATLSLPGGGQTLTLGAAGGGGEVKGAVPVQFVLPPQAMGSTVTLDSRKIGNQPPQLVLMQSSAASTPGGSTLHSSKLQPSVFTLTSNNTNISPSTITAAGGGASTPVNSQGTASTSAPMIVILTGPPATMASTSGAANNSNNAGMPLSVPQPVNSGQVSEPKP